MAQDQIQDFDDEGLVGEVENSPSSKFNPKKLAISLGAVLALGILGTVGYLLFTASSNASGDGTAAQLAEGEVYFYEMPEMLVNLNTGARKASYLKVKVSLELTDPSAAAELDAKLPRVVDRFQVYLRDMRLEDLEGSTGLYRLKEELLRRVNASVAPTVVKDVLFRELLVQ